jgi:hypothetical protein
MPLQIRRPGAAEPEATTPFLNCGATANRPIGFHNCRYIDLGRRPVHTSLGFSKGYEGDEGPLNSHLVRPRRNGQCSKSISQGYSGAGCDRFSRFAATANSAWVSPDRISGSHHIYLHSEVSRPINIQPAGKDAKPYQIRQLRDMIREFGLKLED